MASKNQQHPIAPPALGLRKDVSDLVATADMAIEATNVIMFDATIRPRPALTREGFGNQATFWAVVIGSGTQSPTEWWLESAVSYGSYIIVSAKYMDGGEANPEEAGREILYSSDGGVTWTVSSGSGSMRTGTKPDKVYKLVVCGTKLIALTLGSNDPTAPPSGPEYAYDHEVFSADLSSFPGSPLSWTWIGTVAQQYMYIEPFPPPGGWPPGDPPPPAQWLYTYPGQPSDVFYDDVFHYTWFLMTNAGMGPERPNDEPFGFSSGWHTADGMPEIVCYQFGEEFKGAAGNLPDVYARVIGLQADGSNADMLWTFQRANGFPIDDPYEHETKLIRWKMNWPTPEEDYTLENAEWAGGPGDPNRQVVSCHDPGIANTMWILTSDGLVELDTSDDSYTWLLGPKPNANFQVINVQSNKIIIAGTGAVWYSDDLGTTWEEKESFPSHHDGEHYRELIYHNNAWYMLTSWHPTIVYSEGYIEKEWADMYLVPGSIAPVGFPGTVADPGEVTSIVQMDTDNEEDAIFNGTTKEIFHLDRSTNSWDPITGSSLAGVHGDNPVIFRGFENNALTWLLATNGQEYPQVWEDSMAATRAMGVVPVGDANHQGSGGVEGDAAPIARCMAVAANRVLLGNLPGISSSAVDVSNFNDMDRGWGQVQTSILGDTAGPLVAMNEISALQVAMYKTDAIYHAIAQVEFMGVAAPFRFEMVKAGIVGPCSPMVVVRMHDGTQAYLARDGGVYVYDGVAPQDVGRNVRHMIQPNLDTNNIGKAWGMVDPMRKLVWFFYPTQAGGLNRGVVMSVDQGMPWPVWSVELPHGWQMAAGARLFFSSDKTLGELQEPMGGVEQTLGGFQQGREEMVMGRLNNAWYTQKWTDNGNYTDDGLPINVDLVTGYDFYGGSGIQFKTVHELYHLFNSPDPMLKLEVMLRARGLDATTKETTSVSISTGTKLKSSHRVSGTRFATRLRGSITRMFNWGGAVATFRPRGMR